MSEFKTGIFKGISNDDYHGGPGISSSQIKTLLKSPAHFQYALDNKSDPTPAMLLGSLVHTMVQEPKQIQWEYQFVNCASRGAKVYKQAVEDYPEKTVMLDAEFEKANAMTHAALSNPDISDLLDQAKIEHSIFWEEDGIQCKCRPDIWQPSLGIVCDLKTCADASPTGFEKALVNFGYDLSAAWYLRGIRAATGEMPDEWLWACVEKTEPYITQVYRAAGDVILRGNYLIDKALRLYRECMESGDWHGYGERDEVLTIGIPMWAKYFSEENI